MSTRVVFLSYVVLIYLCMSGCNVDRLELTNPNQLTTETFFKSEEQVQLAVNAVYAGLQTIGLYQSVMYYALDGMALEQINNPVYNTGKAFNNFSFNAENGSIQQYWRDCYTGIQRANFVINNQEAINNIPDAFLSQDKKNKYIGEARFLRALYYFLLVTRFGDVPLYLDIPQDVMGLPRSPATTIWEQIEADLVYAAENCMPKNKEIKGRATSGAAWALLGKAYLFQCNPGAWYNSDFYQSAKEAFLHVIEDNENYRLEEHYSDNFKEETEHGPESIFEIEFNPDMGTNNMWGADGSGLNEATFRQEEYGCFDWFNVFPSRDLINEFETLAENGVKTDPRLGYCIYQTGDLYNNDNDTAYISNDTVWKSWRVVDEVIYRAGWKKYQNYYKQPNEQNYSGINTKVIRLADVLLMMAEVENELGHIPEAIDYLNQVRNRADVMMPNYGTPDMNAIYPVTNKELLRVAIEHERKIELCNEQVRFNDLVRWGRLKEFMLYEAMPGLPKRFKSYFLFNAEKHCLWPIPQAVIDANPNINEEHQNPGY